jgi:hypothetical protein
MTGANDRPGDVEAAPAAPESAAPRAPDAEAAQPLVCDFCGQPAPVVRRVALDRGYERLQTLHAVRYACPRCSDEKEQRRLGLRRG